MGGWESFTLTDEKLERSEIIESDPPERIGIKAKMVFPLLILVPLFLKNWLLRVGKA